jgi:transmembrane sensor
VETGILLRYMAGDATADEVGRVEAWAAADEKNARELRVLAAAWHRAVDADLPTTTETRADARDDAWQRIAARIGDPDAAAQPAAPPRRWLLRAAAVTLLSAGAAVFALSRSGAAPEAAYWATGIGETRDIVLPDGSQVRLAPSSTLRIAGDFADSERRVLLAGTAYFDVQRAEPGRFVVAAGTVETTVLGTRFVVRAYDDEPADVGVVEGRVSVTAPGGAVAEVEAGERALVRDGRVRVQRDDIRPLLGWRDRTLLFRDATLADVARELERWYDVDVEIADARLEQRRITLSAHDVPLTEVLDLMQAALGVRIARQGRTVIIGGGR